jgi:putative ABC transport system ATP-binding protein
VKGSERMYDLTDVTRVYRRGGEEVRAVHRVSLRVDAGEFCVIAGPSGSGKTTLLALMGALDRPTSGQILFEQRELTTLGDGELTDLRLRAIGFIFQQFNLIPTLTAQQNVEAAMAPMGRVAGGRRARARELLASVQLGARGDHLPSMLSGGEQQRVAIARALANKPRLLLADEPTGNLDTRTGEEIIALLTGLVDHHGQTIVLITHDQAIAGAASRVVHMSDGQLVEEASVDEERASSGTRP